MKDAKRDYITVEDEQGNISDYAVEALFEMGDESAFKKRKRNHCLEGRR